MSCRNRYAPDSKTGCAGMLRNGGVCTCPPGEGCRVRSGVFAHSNTGGCADKPRIDGETCDDAKSRWAKEVAAAPAISKEIAALIEASRIKP
jgi:hypothetical protein